MCSKKLIIIFLLMLVCLSSFVTATTVLNMHFNNSIKDLNGFDLNGGTNGYEFAINQNSNDIWGSNDGINSGVGYSSDGVSCVRSESDYITLGNVTINDQSFTWFIEFRNDIHANNYVLISNGGYAYGGLELEFDTVNQLHVTQINGTGAGGDSYENSIYPLTTSVLNMNKLVVVYNNKNLSVYQNGEYMGSHLFVGDISYTNTHNTYLCRREYPASEQYGDYTIKRFYAFDKVLTNEEIIEINNSNRSEIRNSYNIKGNAGYNFVLNQNSDDIFGSNDGTDSNIIYSGIGANFNGVNSYITANNITLSIWSVFVKINNKGQLVDRGMILNNGFAGSGDKGFAFAINQDNTLRLWSGGTGSIDIQTTQTINSNEDYNIVGINDGTNCSIYVNGVLWKTSSCPSSNAPLDELEIGRWDTSNDYFNGTIKEVLIYNTALTIDEILQLNNSGNYTDGATSLTNTSISFNGVDECVSLKNVSSSELKEYSISFFTKVRTLKANQFPVAKGKWGGDVPGDTFFRINQNKMAFVIKFNTSNIFDLFSNATFPLDTWVHIVGTYDGEYMKIYNNGLLNNQSYIGLEVPSSTRPMFVGCLDMPGGYFNGSIDELNIFDFVLNSSEVLELYNSYITKTINITTNLSTSSIVYPTLNFSVNVSIWNSNWDEAPTCQIIDNVSWFSCSPASTSISLSTNETVFNCGSVEGNTGDVSVYANCSSSMFPLVNSSTVTYTFEDYDYLINQSIIWLPFNNTISDFSVNLVATWMKNNGVASTPVYGIGHSGLPNNALNTNSTDYLLMNGSDMTFTTDNTISFWSKADSSFSGSGEITNTKFGKITYDVTETLINYTINNDGTLKTIVTELNLKNSYAMITGVCSTSGTIMKLYINTTEVNSSSITNCAEIE